MQLFTVDLEDWFHILDSEAVPMIESWSELETRLEANTNKILEILDQNNIKALFFVLGWVAERFPNLVRRIHQNGHEIGTHSYGHELVYKLSPKQFRSDLKRSIEHIAYATGDTVVHYRAPGFSINEKCDWSLEILVEEGIKFDYSLFFAKRAHGGFASKNFNQPFNLNIKGSYLVEFPMSFYRIFGKKIILTGGGYFRMCPKTIFRLLPKDRNYSMWYFHPRDIDPRQPRINNLGATKHFKTYVGLGGALEKLKYIAGSFKFDPPTEVCNYQPKHTMDFKDLFNG